MEFDISYNTNCSLRLLTGRGIILDQLVQARTYAGWLEGAPNNKLNNSKIECALERARTLSGFDSQPLLIEPERRDYLRNSGDMGAIVERQLKRPPEFRCIPEWLPQIECIGTFVSNVPARDETKGASSLTIVWYQNIFGIEESAVELLRNVDWDNHAVDWEY